MRVTEVLEEALASARSRRALCAEVSHAHGEPLDATASWVESWILVEYRGLWGRDTIGASSFSEPVKEHLRAHLRALPHSRLLFIRRPERRGAALAVYFGRSLEREQPFRALEIESYDELARIDFADETVGEPLTHPLLVVCTHGKRDRCCAKYGRPLYEELREQAEPDWVWQSTHVGGDRFAGNVVCLPHGLYFGRVERPAVWPLLDEYLAGRIELEHYRGRSCYPFAVQAAERKVREQAGVTGLDELELVSSERTGDEGWTIRFGVRSSGDVHEVEVVTELAEEPTYLTCAAPSPQRPRRHRATAHRVRPSR